MWSHNQLTFCLSILFLIKKNHTLFNKIYFIHHYQAAFRYFLSKNSSVSDKKNIQGTRHLFFIPLFRFAATEKGDNRLMQLCANMAEYDQTRFFSRVVLSVYGLGVTLKKNNSNTVYAASSLRIKKLWYVSVIKKERIIRFKNN